MLGPVDDHQRERAAAGVLVAQEQPRGLDREGLVLLHRERGVGGDRRDGRGPDVQGDRGDVRVERAVIGLEREGVGAVEVGERRVGERPVGIERDHAVGRVVDQHRRERVLGRVGGAHQHAGGRDQQRSVLGHRIGGGDHRRGDVLDVEGDRRRRAGQAVGVDGDVGEAVGPGVAGRRRVCEGPVAGQRRREGAVRRPGDEFGLQGQSRGADGAGQDARGGDGQRVVLHDAIGDGGGLGRRVDRVDDQRDRGRLAGDQPVGRLVGESVGPGESGRRDVAERPVVVERERAVDRAGLEDRVEDMPRRVGVVAQDARRRDREVLVVLGQGVQVGIGHRRAVDREGHLVARRAAGVVNNELDVVDGNRAPLRQPGEGPLDGRVGSVLDDDVGVGVRRGISQVEGQLRPREVDRARGGELAELARAGAVERDGEGRAGIEAHRPGGQRAGGGAVARADRPAAGRRGDVAEEARPRERPAVEVHQGRPGPGRRVDLERALIVHGPGESGGVRVGGQDQRARALVDQRRRRRARHGVIHDQRRARGRDVGGGIRLERQRHVERIGPAGVVGQDRRAAGIGHIDLLAFQVVAALGEQERVVVDGRLIIIRRRGGVAAVELQRVQGLDRAGRPVGGRRPVVVCPRADPGLERHQAAWLERLAEGPHPDPSPLAAGTAPGADRSTPPSLLAHRWPRSLDEVWIMPVMEGVGSRRPGCPDRGAGLACGHGCIVVVAMGDRRARSVRPRRPTPAPSRRIEGPGGLPAHLNCRFRTNRTKNTGIKILRLWR